MLYRMFLGVVVFLRFVLHGCKVVSQWEKLHFLPII